MSSLVSDIFGLRPDEAISAGMALETPQIMLRWRLADSTPDIDLISIRRSLFRFPEELSEGDAILDEVPDLSDIRTSYADTAVDPFKVYYYSVFFTHKGPYSMDLNMSVDVERLGIVRGSYARAYTDDYWILAREEGGDPVLWGFDANKELVESKIDLSGIVQEREERVVAIIFYDDLGATHEFQIVTAQRFIAFTVDKSAEVATQSDITAEFDFLGTLTPGFEVTGATRIGADLAVLDSANEEITTLTTAGAVSATLDLSAMLLGGSLIGLSHDAANTRFLFGSGKVIYGVDDGLASADNTDIDSTHPVRQRLNSGFTYDPTLGAILLLDSSLGVYQRYVFADFATQMQLEEAYVPGPGVTGLWKLDEETGVFADHSGNGYDGSEVGTLVRSESGKFDEAITIDEVTDGVDLSAATAATFDGDDGFVAFWYKTPYRGFTTSSLRTFFQFAAVGVEELRLDTLDGDIVGTFVRNATTNTVTWSGGLTSIDDGIFHHIALRWSGGVGGDFEIVVDGVQQASTIIADTHTATWNDLTIGDPVNSQSVLGTYDDFVFVLGSYTDFTRYQLVTRGNRAHALSGRDYDEPGQHWRDRLFFEFQEFIQRNDANPSLKPQDKELTDGEVIFRQLQSELDVGDLGGLSRMFGLFLDRSTDRRKFFMNHLTLRSAEYEFLDELGQHINAIDIDPFWNVDMRRRFLEVMFFSYQRSGTLDAFKRLVRFLGFRLLCPDDVVGSLVEVARRFFDSVIDPDRPDVPFDTSFFDSGDDDVQFVTVLLKFYKEVFRSATGATSSLATRELVDTSADFTRDAEVGSMLIINDADDEGDNGQYLITTVVDSTTVVVDRDWPEGSNSGLSYRLHWRVPVPDPYNEQIVERLNRIKARWQNLSVTA